MADSVKSSVKKKSASAKYPTKTSINLIYSENHTGKNIFSLVVFGIFLVVLAIFTKFMVIDQISYVNQREAAYNEVQKTLAELQEANSVYAEVEEEYAHFGNGYMNVEELTRQDRAAMMEVIDSKVKVDSGIKSISIEDNVAVITIEKTTLSEVSQVVEALESSSIVAYVSPYTASTDAVQEEIYDEEGNLIDTVYYDAVTAEIRITFLSPLEVETEEAEDTESLADQLATRREAVEEEGLEA